MKLEKMLVMTIIAILSIFVTSCGTSNQFLSSLKPTDKAIHSVAPKKITHAPAAPEKNVILIDGEDTREEIGEFDVLPLIESDNVAYDFAVLPPMENADKVPAETELQTKVLEVTGLNDKLSEENKRLKVNLELATQHEKRASDLEKELDQTKDKLSVTQTKVLEVMGLNDKLSQENKGLKFNLELATQHEKRASDLEKELEQTKEELSAIKKTDKKTETTNGVLPIPSTTNTESEDPPILYTVLNIAGIITIAVALFILIIKFKKPKETSQVEHFSNNREVDRDVDLEELPIPATVSNSKTSPIRVFRGSDDENFPCVYAEFAKFGAELDEFTNSKPKESSTKVRRVIIPEQRKEPIKNGAHEKSGPFVDINISEIIDPFVTKPKVRRVEY
jgi:hypothetical protein